MTIKKAALFLLPALLLSACAETPMGPTAMVLPGKGKSYAAFQQEQDFCRSQASAAVQGQAERQNHKAIYGGLAATALGAGLGAAAGGGAGAGIGAGAGALGGALGGGLYSKNQQGSIQTQYNNAYVQCMVAYKNVIPR
ncbi:glycine zipper family protein [Acetobacter farinalis]|uniref:Glycine zipper family protein n=1 Tax=Acetobacter farinalis TaxID=1260984 RepID=A0ABT3Q7L5_9PROT|nr:glycine zipper family protein [Acetobacter farinalis]MCX2561274.1 glycine zipper family protein [Acetobacter farinalis]NHO29956.1 glycine zipper family protein [Acetobacter farinalis]